MCLIASLYNYIENESQHESGQGQDRLHYGPGLQCLGYRHVKEFFTIQKPASFTWDSTMEPAPVASTTSSTLAPGVIASTGATIPAAVVMATVAEPVAIRMSAATSHANRITLIFAPVAISAMALPTPLLIRTCLKAPPAPMIRMIVAIGARHSLVKRDRSCLLKPRANPSEKKEKTAKNEQGNDFMADKFAEHGNEAGRFRIDNISRGTDKHQYDRRQNGKQRDAETWQTALCFA